MIFFLPLSTLLAIARVEMDNYIAEADTTFLP